MITIEVHPTRILTDYLDKTLNALKTYGWVQKKYGTRYGEDSGFCLVGAAMDVGAPYSVATALATTLRQRPEYRTAERVDTGIVIDFNDRDDVDFRDIEDLIVETKRRLEA